MEICVSQPSLFQVAGGNRPGNDALTKEVEELKKKLTAKTQDLGTFPAILYHQVLQLMTLERCLEEPGRFSGRRIQQARGRVQQIHWRSFEGKEGLDRFWFLRAVAKYLLNGVVIGLKGRAIYLLSLHFLTVIYPASFPCVYRCIHPFRKIYDRPLRCNSREGHRL